MRQISCLTGEKVGCPFYLALRRKKARKGSFNIHHFLMKIKSDIFYWSAFSYNGVQLYKRGLTRHVVWLRGGLICLRVNWQAGIAAGSQVIHPLLEPHILVVQDLELFLNLAKQFVQLDLQGWRKRRRRRVLSQDKSAHCWKFLSLILSSFCHYLFVEWWHPFDSVATSCVVDLYLWSLELSLSTKFFIKLESALTLEKRKMAWVSIPVVVGAGGSRKRSQW